MAFEIQHSQYKNMLNVAFFWSEWNEDKTRLISVFVCVSCWHVVSSANYYCASPPVCSCFSLPKLACAKNCTFTNRWELRGQEGVDLKCVEHLLRSERGGWMDFQWALRYTQSYKWKPLYYITAHSHTFKLSSTLSLDISRCPSCH